MLRQRTSRSHISRAEPSLFRGRVICTLSSQGRKLDQVADHIVVRDGHRLHEKSIKQFRIPPGTGHGASCTHLRRPGRPGRKAQERNLLASLPGLREPVLDIRGKRLVVYEVFDGFEGKLLGRLVSVEHDNARMGKLDSVRSFDGSRQVLDVGDEERRSGDGKLVGYRARSVRAVLHAGRSAHQAHQR